MSAIPERQPISDVFNGVLLRIADAYNVLIAYLLATKAPSEITPFSSGALIVRYGLAYLGRSSAVIVPGLLALDNGAMLTGEEAWDFLRKRATSHPRAEVVGFRDDGNEDMVALKHLDMAQAPRILIFDNLGSTRPLGIVQALIATEAETSSLPPRLLEYLPRFNSLADWRAHGS